MALAPMDTARPAPVVVDRFGRRLRYIRLSVTELCNFSCTYCNPVKGCAETHPYRLSWDDLSFLVSVCVDDLGVEALRLTGGEPTVRPGLVEWIASIRALGGLRDISLTTNGLLLDRLAAPLAVAGLTRVNVSLDTFDEERFRTVTRGGDLRRVLAGVEAARAHFRRVKLNAVALRGMTERELGAFVRYSDEKQVEVRFIELMPIFDQKDYFTENFISVETLREELHRLGHRLTPIGDGAAEGNHSGYGPATTFRVEGTRAVLGFISQMSNTKCLACNKLRLTSDGALKPCLLSPQETDLLPAIRERHRAVIADAMREAFLSRAERYDLLTATTQPVGRSMQATGG